MNELVLHVDSTFESPWAMSAFVACEEKGVPYTLKLVSLAAKETLAPAFQARTHRIPALQRGAYWLAESTAIAEYLAENFPFPAYPRLFPENLDERGTCRELQAWLRTDLLALRQERPSSTLWGERATSPLSAAGTEAAERLIEVALKLLAHGRPSLFAQWCIADVDLALALQRLLVNHHPLLPVLVAYAQAIWARPACEKWHRLRLA